MNVIVLVLSIVITFTAPAFAQNAWTEPARAVPPYADVTVTGSATPVCPLDLIRKKCTCRNMSDTDSVRIGDSSVTTSRGVQLRAGEPVQIESSAAVYMIAEANTVIVSCTAETR